MWSDACRMESTTKTEQKAANVSMGTDPTDSDTADASAHPNNSAADGEMRPRPRSRELGEGLGVFRALLLMAIFYLAAGGIVWLIWSAFRHLRTH